MGTGKAGARETIRALKDNKTRLKAFGRGAKDSLSANKENLGKNDNAGMIHQVRRDPSTLRHLGQVFANTLAVDPRRLPRVVAGDTGGAFGVKGHSTREDVAVCAAAIDLGRSVKWIEDRVEHLTVGGTARDETISLSMALDNDGHVLGMRADLIMDQGAYPAIPFGAPLFSRIMKVMMPGTYRPQAFELRTRIVVTNKAQYVAYRGPWANETWARERMLDIVARRMGLTATEIRERNMYGPSELPVKMITGPTLDVEMSAKATLEKAISVANVSAFRSERKPLVPSASCSALASPPFTRRRQAHRTTQMRCFPVVQCCRRNRFARPSKQTAPCPCSLNRCPTGKVTRPPLRK